MVSPVRGDTMEGGDSSAPCAGNATASAKSAGTASAAHHNQTALKTRVKLVAPYLERDRRTEGRLARRGRTDNNPFADRFRKAAQQARCTVPPSVILARNLVIPRRFGGADENMESRNDSTIVEIFGQTYNVRGEGDPDYLSELARFVDSRMREVASQVATVDPMKIAILAALNIADELSRYRKERESASDALIEKTEELANRLSEVMS
jgi:cell division protein ZapA